MSFLTRAGAGTAGKVAGFTAGLAVAFGGAWMAGAAVGPVGSSASAGTEADAGHGYRTAGVGRGGRADDSESGRAGSSSTDVVPGLAVAQDGYRLELADDVVAAGTRPLRFTIDGPGNRPVTSYDIEHEKQLHLIVVRRDHAGFQHLHPTLDPATGTWTARAQLTPGSWRVFTDFTATGGPALVLGSDLLVAGHVAAPASAQETRTDVVGAYTVTVDGRLRAGERSPLTLRVSKDGTPVTDLQPYLGAYGHLVVLREGDLAYLHVHPGGEPGDGQTRPGPVIAFEAEVPSAGRYHLYLDFQHDGEVSTAHVVLEAPPTTSSGRGAEPADHGDAEHTH